MLSRALVDAMGQACRASLIRPEGELPLAQLREANAFIKHDMENTCFICGVDRFTFDTQAI